MKELIHYNGSTRELYKIYIKNIILNIITLWVYRFWAKTNLRTYIWSHFKIDDDPFVYHGTALELLKGFLKALPIFVLFFCLFLIPYFDLVSLVIIIWAVNFALYSRYKYLYSRTSWRGIRFYLNGSAKKYANRMTLLSLKNICTIGVLGHKIAIERMKWIFDNIQYGEMNFETNLDSQDLNRIHWITYALAIPTLFLSRIYFIYWVSLYTINRTSVGALQLRVTYTIGRLFWLISSNFLINIFTLFLATPYTLNRTMKFNSKYTELEGDLKTFVVKAHGKDLSGEEGSGELMGIGDF